MSALESVRMVLAAVCQIATGAAFGWWIGKRLAHWQFAYRPSPLRFVGITAGALVACVVVAVLAGWFFRWVLL